MLWFQRYKPKSTFHPYVLFLAMVAILVGRLVSSDTFFELDTPMMIVANFG